MNERRGRRFATFVIVVYFSICLLLSYRYSLWLDEVLQLVGIAKPSVGSMLKFVAGNAGGVPLGYFVESFSVRFFGLSAMTARLPSVIGGALACAGVVVLAPKFGVRSPALCLVLFATIPLQLRYAVEARPYSLGLCGAVWATVFAIRLAEFPTNRIALSYATVITATLYLQPFGFFVIAAHLLWLASSPRTDLKWKTFLYASIASGAALLVFTPWLIWAHEAAQKTPLV